MNDFQDTFTPGEIRFGPAEGRPREVSRFSYVAAVLTVTVAALAVLAVLL